MSTARDPNNFLRILDAPGTVENYFLSHAKGEEALSVAYKFTLHLRSRGEIPDPGEWIGASVTFGMGASDSDMRRINGQCTRIEKSYQREAYVEFELDVEPAFVLAKQRRDCRIFTDQSAMDILQTIFSEHDFDYDVGNVNFADTVREYCVQYWETDFDFCCRLMEEEGLFYYFLYDESAGQYQHTMYLADSETGYFDGLIYDVTFSEDEHHQGITSIDLQHMQYTNSWVTHDYNYEAPTSLTPIKTGTRFDYSVPGTKFYQWRGKYKEMDPPGQRISRFGMQLAESASVIMSGVGTYMCFMPAARFDIIDKRLKPGERRIAVRSVTHDCHNPFNLDEGEFFYNQSFTAVPSTEPFHPPRITPKAVVQGPQTAVVVDEVDPDGYGRVKAQFHWDTAGTSTCWLRVAQQWAGDQIGAQWIPRLGWEVLVVFLEGDPDYPVVVGGLYNADKMAPFTLPANISQSGWRTRSYPQGQVTNELIFEDKQGSEEVYLYAGRNYRREIEKDETSTIGEYRKTKVGKDQTLDVEGDSTTTIGGDDSLTVKKDQTVDIKGDVDLTIGKDQTVKIEGGAQAKVGKDAELTVSKDLSVTVDGDITLTCKGSITIQVGGSSIEISKTGVSIEGVEVTIVGGLVRIN